MTSRPNFVDPLTLKQAGKRTGTAGSITGAFGAGKTTAAALAAEQNRHVLREAEEDDDAPWDPDADDSAVGTVGTTAAAAATADDDSRAGIQSVRFQDPAELLASTGALTGAKGKAFQHKDLGVGGGTPCVACGKSVGFAEKIVFQEKVWHRNSCFKCSKCDKPLSVAADALEGAGQPVCKSCHTKHFAGPSKRF